MSNRIYGKRKELTVRQWKQRLALGAVILYLVGVLVAENFL